MNRKKRTRSLLSQTVRRERKRKRGKASCYNPNRVSPSISLSRLAGMPSIETRGACQDMTGPPPNYETKRQKRAHPKIESYVHTSYAYQHRISAIPLALAQSTSLGLPPRKHLTQSTSLGRAWELKQSQAGWDDWSAGSESRHWRPFQNKVPRALPTAGIPASVAAVRRHVHSPGFINNSLYCTPYYRWFDLVQRPKRSMQCFVSQLSTHELIYCPGLPKSGGSVPRNHVLGTQEPRHLSQTMQQTSTSTSR